MLDKLKNYFTKEEEYVDDYEEDYDPDEYDEEYDDEDDDDYVSSRFSSTSFEDVDTELSLEGSTGHYGKKSSSKCSIIMDQPTNFNDAIKIAGDLKQGRIVILNLEDVDFDEARKIVDFLSGTSFALGGSVDKISHKIVLFAPKHANVNNNIILLKKAATPNPYKGDL